jgi:hypothetical protein
VPLQVLHGFSFGSGLYQFFELMSLSATMSKAWSATMRFNLAFSNSNWRRRCASQTLCLADAVPR